MSFKPILNTLEINFWQSATSLMHESSIVRFLLPKFFRFYHALPRSESLVLAVLWLASGLTIGFALGALYSLIW